MENSIVDLIAQDSSAADVSDAIKKFFVCESC